jgi:hypothetical protein
MPSRLRQAVAVWPYAALALLVGVLFHDLGTGHWRGDDTAILIHALESPGLSAFYDPQVWQRLSPSNLTPWVTLSFKLDLRLAGLDPRFAYAHHGLSLLLRAWTAFALLRRWLPATWAALAVALFLVGAPTASVAELLMTRHYLEGLLLALLALLAFDRAVNTRRLAWSVAGALAYAAACSAKEIYVPLVLVILALPGLGGPRKRLLLAWPFVAVAILYVGWRRHMLGTTIGGYQAADLTSTGPSVASVLATLGRVPEYLLGPLGWPAVLVCFAAVAVSLLARSSGRLLVAVLAACVLGPLVPLVGNPGIHGPDRYLFLPWFAFIIAFVMSLRTALAVVSSNRQVRAAVAVSLCLAIGALALGNTQSLSMQREAVHREFDAFSRFLRDADASQAFVPTPLLLANYWAVTSLCAINLRLGQTCAVPLLEGFPPGTRAKTLHRYDERSQRLVDVSSTLAEASARAAAVDLQRPLSVSMELAGGWVRWRFGPYRDGKYFVVSPEIGRYPLAPEGGLRTALGAVDLRVQYISPEGWSTYSKLLHLRTGMPVASARGESARP